MDASFKKFMVHIKLYIIYVFKDEFIIKIVLIDLNSMIIYYKCPIELKFQYLVSYFFKCLGVC